MDKKAYLLPNEVELVFKATPSMSFSFIHLNTQSLRNKSDEFSSFLDRFCFPLDVKLLTETLYKFTQVEMLDNYVVFSLNRNNKNGHV